jgi:hypothetical protein
MEIPNPEKRELIVINKELLAREKTSVPEGENWVVKQLLKSEILVKKGAKLTVTEIAARNLITVEEGGELVIEGEELMNEISKAGQDEVVNTSQNQEVESSGLGGVDRGIESSEMYDSHLKYVEVTLGLSPEFIKKAEECISTLVDLKSKGVDIKNPDVREKVMEDIMGLKFDKDENSLFDFNGSNGNLVIEEMVSDYKRFNDYLNNDGGDLKKRDLKIKSDSVLSPEKDMEEGLKQAREELLYKYILDKKKAGKLN